MPETTAARPQAADADPPATELEANPVRLDWRGTPITENCQVFFPRPWGRNKHSTEMVEARVQGFTKTGRVTVEVIATSREHEYEGSQVYALPCHSVTVVIPPPAQPAPL